MPIGTLGNWCCIILFRSEALSHRHDRLAGNVAIAIPLSWQVIAYGLLGSLLATVTLLSLGSYARVETVPGVISPDKGVVIIVPSRPGVLTDLFVHDGEFVEKDTPLAVVRVDQDLRAGESVAALNAAAIANQDQSLSGQERENSHAADARKPPNHAVD